MGCLNNEYLLKNLMDAASTEDLKEHIDLLKIELDWHIYHYGQHFSKPKEGRKIKETVSRKLIKFIRPYVKHGNKFYQKDGLNILSLIYFSNFNQLLESAGYNLLSPYWAPVQKVITNKEIIRAVNYLNENISAAPFHFLISPDFQEQVKHFQHLILAFFAQYDFRGLFLYTDQYFYSKVAIKAFRRLQRPSFVLSHGLPGIYNKHVDSRTDFLLVWGERIKQNYINAGFDPNKVLIAGHPAYNNFKRTAILRNNLEDVLVLAKAVSPHQHTYTSISNDRGNMITYLLNVKAVLQRLGVRSAKLRPHPTMSGDWLLRFVNDDFYKLDAQPLQQSLNTASMVIGPTSTILLESAMYGVNYVVFEPQVNSQDILNYTVVPPFDGSDSNIPVAKSEEELYDFLQHKQQINPCMLDDYMSPFNLDLIKKNIL